VARSGPVGRLPLVARSDSMRFGNVPEQVKQNTLTSARANGPVRPAVNVWPPQFAVSMPLPLLLRPVFCWSSTGGLRRMTASGVLARSVFVGTPV